ncbi:MAG: hypothetical protein ACI8UD_003255 [Planctomycetota bacterium]|jgi:hypothetical protein
MQLKIAATMLLGATSLFAQCNTSTPEIRTFSPTWQASFYYPSANGTTLNQYLDITVGAPLTVNSMASTTYNQFPTTAPQPWDQVGNVAEVRIYTFPVTHIGNEASSAGWTQVSSAEMTIVAWSGSCVIQGFKDPVSGVPTPLVLPVGSYGLCVEYIPTTWTGTAALPQTQVLLNPGVHSCLAFVPAVYPGLMAEDQFVALNSGGIQTNGWQVVDVAGALGPNVTPGGVAVAQPNLGFNYTPDAAAGRSETIGQGCYNLPFMIHEFIAENTTPIDLASQSYTAVLTASANGGFYNITNGGIPYIAPPAGATNLTLGGTAPAPVATSSANADDATWGHTLSVPLSVPNPGGGLMATELGINSNGKVYFDVVPPTDTSYAYNGANYGGIGPFRDLATSWAVFNTDLDPSTGVGDVYVMEPSPNLGGVMIWWDNVPNWPAVAGATNSCSIEFTADGTVCNIAYGSNLVANGSGDALVGFSAGNGEPVGGLIDWSAIPAAPGAQLSGDGSSAPTMGLSARPIGGTSPDLVMGNLPSTIAGAPRVGLFVINTVGLPGIDLGFIGMPGCPLFVGGSPLIITGIEDTVNSPGEIRLPFALPAGFAGTDIYLQGGALHFVFPPNAFGVTLSNAVCFTLGSV